MMIKYRLWQFIIGIVQKKSVTHFLSGIVERVYNEALQKPPIPDKRNGGLMTKILAKQQCFA